MITSKELKAYIAEHGLGDVFADKASVVLQDAQFKSKNSEDGDPSYRRRLRCVAGTTRPTSRGIVFCPEITLPAIAEQGAVDNGVPILINHDTGSVIGGGEPVVPIGRTTDGEFDAAAEKALLDFFIDDDPKAPESGKVLSAIDDKRMTDVSIGGLGKFMCNFCETRMGYFGCSEGHLPLMQIMIDKNGKETYDREVAVDTFTIYAVFVLKELVELSMAWKGAIPGTEIMEQYSAYKDHIDHVFGDTQFFTFTDLSGALFKKLPEQPQPHIGGPTMSTPTHDHEVELAEVRKDRDKLQKELDAANATIAEYSPKIEGYDKLQAEFDALKEKYQEAEKAEQELESRKVQSKQFDDFTANLRVQLKMAKDKQINVTEAEKKQFAEDVDKMTDINSMARMLSEMGTKKESNGEFLKRIGVSIGDALPADTNNKEFQAQQVQQIMSNYD